MTGALDTEVDCVSSADLFTQDLYGLIPLQQLLLLPQQHQLLLSQLRPDLLKLTNAPLPGRTRTQSTYAHVAPSLSCDVTDADVS